MATKWPRLTAVTIDRALSGERMMGLDRLHQVTLQGDTGHVSQTTEITPRQREILHQLQVEPPPRLTSLTPSAA